MYADFITICMFIIVNFIAIWLRFSDEDIKRTYKMPLNYGRLPLISVGGLLIGLFVIINLCKKQN